jgi:adenylate cyclase
MSKFKKRILFILTVISITIFFFGISLFFPKEIERFDSIVQDSMFLVRGEKEDSKNILIIDIDEKSLQELGQWPWSRNIIARILENLTLNGIAIIGVDIVFSEEDRTSPSQLLKKLDINLTNLGNYDEELAYMVENTPTILGYQFELEKQKFINTEVPNFSALIIEKNKNLDYDDYLIKAHGTILNYHTIQNKAYSSGFFNVLPNANGSIKKVPLLISYNGQLYPSLSLELYRISMGIKKILINYNDFGIEYIKLGDTIIPTDRFGRVSINYLGKEKTFKYISAVDIYNNSINQEELSDKIALIGTSAVGLKDLRSTPFDSVFPGVEIHANVIDNFITKDFFSSSESLFFNLLVVFLLVFFTMLLVTYLPLWAAPILLLLLTSSIWYINYYILFTEKIILNTFLFWLSIIISFFTALLINYWFEIKSKQAIKNKFALKVSEDVMKSLIKNEYSNEFVATQREITIFFSDIRNFTNISEKLENPVLLIELLNIYMTPMSDIIIDNKGTIDKFIGDSIMAYWNAPSYIDNHATSAVDSALEQLYALRTLNDKIKNDNRFKIASENDIELLAIRIGIHTGLAIVGEMGSLKRSDYTVIGDSINTGSRLESLCKYYNVTLIISDYTKSLLDDKYIYKYLDLVTVKGKTKPMKIWQVMDYSKVNNKYENNLYSLDYEIIKKNNIRYSKAIEMYLNSSFEEAYNEFSSILKNEVINKELILIYLKRCKGYIQNKPKNFDGVYIHNEK